MQLSEIDLSDIEGFWTEPMAVREARSRPCAEKTQSVSSEAETEYLPAGPLLRPPNTPTSWSRVARPTSPVRSRHQHPDLPPEFNEFFGSAIDMDDSLHARLRKPVSASFTLLMLQRNIEDVDAAAKTIVHRLQEAGCCDFVTAAPRGCPSRSSAT